MAPKIVFAVLSAMFISFLLTFKHPGKFNVGDCVKGTAFTYKVFRKNHNTYDLLLLHKNGNMLLEYRKVVVDRSFVKTECPKCVL